MIRLVFRYILELPAEASEGFRGLQRASVGFSEGFSEVSRRLPHAAEQLKSHPKT